MKTIRQTLKLALLSILLLTIGCKKESINKTHTFQVTGNTAAMVLTVAGKTYYGGVQPVFSLKKGEQAVFQDPGMFPNDIRSTTITIDGKVAKEWTSQSGVFSYSYTAN